jgi:hypothetical protein
MKALYLGGTKLTTPYTIDRSWADTYTPAIEKIVRSVAHRIISFKIAPEQEDAKHAADYIITVETGTIACRIRRENNYLKNHPKDFTIRTWRRNGLKTELAKIKEGFGRWYIYAWTKDAKQIESAILVDLNRLRQSKILNKIDVDFWDKTPEYIRSKLENGIDHRKNPDDKTGFVGIPLSMLDTHGCILEDIKN